MLLSHAVLLAEARSYLAALADNTPSVDAAIEYERVLLQLDWLHDGFVPPITVVPSGDRRVLFTVAKIAITALDQHGVDRLDLALCRSMLEAAYQIDAGPSTGHNTGNRSRHNTGHGTGHGTVEQPGSPAPGGRQDPAL